MKGKYLLLASSLALAISASVAPAAIIITENFGGLGANPLNATTADTFASGITSAGGSSTWTAYSHYYANGDVKVTTGLESSAFLNLGNYINASKGTTSGKFILSATITQPTGGGWVSLGFFKVGVTNNSFAALTPVSTATALHRASDASANYYAGVANTNSNDPGVLTGTVTFTTTIDFTTAGGYNGTTNFGKVTFANSFNASTFSYTYTADPVMNYVGLSTAASSNPVATVSNFKLEQIPEPTATAFGLLSLGGLLLRRHRPQDHQA